MQQKFRRPIGPSALTAALLASLSGPAFPQTTPSASTGQATELDTLVVKGARLQNSRAISERETNVQVTDSVTSDEAGRLPDFNIGEALQRLPGIAVQNDQAEVRFVTVRALNASYNYTTVDGVSIAVPDRNGRRVYMDVMPASLADRIDVYKSFTPNLEGGAIGGIIDIRTGTAFGKPKSSVDVEAQIGRYSNDEGYNGSGPSGSLDASYSTIFGNADQFGLVLFGNYYKRDSYIPQAEWGSNRYFYNADGAQVGAPGPNTGTYPGTGWAVPAERRWFYYHNKRERLGGGAKLEYRAENGDYLFLRGFWNQATDDEMRQTDLWTFGGGGTLSNQTSTGGTLTGSESLSIQENLGMFDFERAVWGLAGGGDHMVADSDLSWRLNYSGASFRNYENWAEWRQNSSALGFNYERTGDTYAFTPVNPEVFNDYSAYAPYRRQFDERELEEDTYEAKVDFGSDLHWAGGGWRFETGAGLRRIEREFDENRDRYLPNSGNTYSLLAAGVLRDDLCLKAPGALSNQCMTVIDPRAAVLNWDAHYAAHPDQWRLDRMENDDNNLDYSLNETVASAYGLLKYSGDRLAAVFGARYEDTRNTARGRRQVDGTWTNTSNSGSYSDLLPSITMNYSLSEAVKLRGAVSKSLGRVPFNAIAPVGESLTEDGSIITLTRSNPDLLPRRANNFDLAVDWYFGEGRGLFSTSLFYKEVKNEFFKAVSSQMIDFDGRQVEATVSQSMNSGSPVDIKGVEFNLIRELDFMLPRQLAGFTFAANLTLLDSNFKQVMNDGSEVELGTMNGQPEKAYNVALNYEAGPVSARLAYNYNGERMSERINTTSAYRNRWDGEERSLDLKLRYKMSDAWAMTFTASNITDEGRTEWVGWNQELPMVVAEFGRAYFVGFTYRH